MVVFAVDLLMIEFFVCSLIRMESKISNRIQLLSQYYRWNRKCFGGDSRREYCFRYTFADRMHSYYKESNNSSTAYRNQWTQCSPNSQKERLIPQIRTFLEHFVHL